MSPAPAGRNRPPASAAAGVTAADHRLTDDLLAVRQGSLEWRCSKFYGRDSQVFGPLAVAERRDRGGWVAYVAPDPDGRTKPWWRVPVHAEREAQRTPWMGRDGGQPVG